jgi:hypothetical protein
MLPPPLLCCHHHCRSAAAVTMLLPLPPLCCRRCCGPATLLPAAAAGSASRWQRLRHAARHSRAAAALPLLLCQRCHRAPAANTTCRCRPHAAHFRRAAAVLLLPTLPPCCRHRHGVANAAAMLLPPAAPLPAVAELLPPPPPPPMRCCRLPRAPDAAAVLPAVAVPLPRCLRRSANAATALPPLTARCRHHRCAAHCCRAAAAPEVAMLRGTSALPRNGRRRAMVGGRGHGRQRPWFRCQRNNCEDWVSPHTKMEVMWNLGKAASTI